MKNKFLFLAALLFAFAPAIHAAGVVASAPTASKYELGPGEENIIRVDIQNIQRTRVSALIDLQIINPDGEIVFASLTDDPANSKISVKKAWYRQFKITPDPKIDPRWIPGDYYAHLVLRDAAHSENKLWTMTGGKPVLFVLAGAVEGAIARKDTESKGGDTGVSGRKRLIPAITRGDADLIGAALSKAFRDENISDIASLISTRFSGGVTYAQALEGLRQFFTNVSQINYGWYTDAITDNSTGPSRVSAHVNLQYFDPSSNRLEIRDYTLTLQMIRESDGKIRIVSGNLENLTTALPTVNVPGTSVAGAPTVNSVDVQYNFSGANSKQFAPRTISFSGSNISPDAVVNFVDPAGRTFNFPLSNSVGNFVVTFDTVIVGGFSFGLSSAGQIRLLNSGGGIEIVYTDDFWNHGGLLIAPVTINGSFFITNPDGQRSNTASFNYVLTP